MPREVGPNTPFGGAGPSSRTAVRFAQRGQGAGSVEARSLGGGDPAGPMRAHHPTLRGHADTPCRTCGVTRIPDRRSASQSSERRLNPAHATFQVFLDFVLPKADDAPTRLAELAEVPLVACSVLLNLVLPELLLLFVVRSISSSMPKITVTTYGDLVSREHNIRTPNCLVINSIPITQHPQSSPQ